jgi:membrane dipeptidase
VDPVTNAGHLLQRALDLIDAVRTQVELHPRELRLALTAADVEAAQKRGQLAVLMGLEGGHPLGGDLRELRNMYRLGVRYMTITWSNTNELGDSSGDIDKPNVAHHNGLTPLGRQAVAEMNRLGMLVDISHVADKTFFDTIEIARTPVIASHSSCRALTNHPRNMTDEMLRAVARNGGVVMVNFFSGFVDEEFRKAFEPLRPEMDKAAAEVAAKYKDDPAARTREWFAVGQRIAARIPRPPLKSLIDHIEHVARVAGVDHAGIGSDFDGIPSLPQGIDSAADLPKIATELRKRGFSDRDIANVFSGNILRVMRAAERFAQSARAPTRSGTSSPPDETHPSSAR